MIPIVALLLPETPAAVGLHAYGATVDSIAPPAKGANPITIAFNVLGTASKSGGFWLLFASFFVCGASTNGLIGTHLISYCIDHGLPEDLAAGTRIVRQGERPDRVRLVAGTSSAPALSPSRPARCARSSATITSLHHRRAARAAHRVAAPSVTVSRPPRPERFDRRLIDLLRTTPTA
jgi:hypothetical protein